MNYKSLTSYLFGKKDLDLFNPYNVPEKLKDNFSKKKAVGTGAGEPNEERRVRDFAYSSIFTFLSASSVGTAIQIFRYNLGYLYDILGKGGADGLGCGLLIAAIPLAIAARYYMKKALSDNP